jgi:hypothetical protein
MMICYFHHASQNISQEMEGWEQSDEIPGEQPENCDFHAHDG